MRLEKAYIQVTPNTLALARPEHPPCCGTINFISRIFALSMLTHARTLTWMQYEFFGELFTTNTVEETTSTPNFEYTFVHHVPQVLPAVARSFVTCLFVCLLACVLCGF